MKHANVAIADVQTLKAKRADLFKQFEAEPGKLWLAKEIRIIDDQIAEESQAREKSRDFNSCLWLRNFSGPHLTLF